MITKRRLTYIVTLVACIGVITVLWQRAAPPSDEELVGTLRDFLAGIDREPEIHQDTPSSIALWFYVEAWFEIAPERSVRVGDYELRFVDLAAKGDSSDHVVYDYVGNRFPDSGFVIALPEETAIARLVVRPSSLFARVRALFSRR